MDSRLRHLSGLRYFEAAARLSSYSKAAEELFVSQAAVSQKIRQLEQVLGCKLFIRQGREMALTEKGKTLYKQVSKGFESILTGLNQITNEPIDGVLSVSSPPSFASRWLLPRLWKFSIRHPSIPIRVMTTCNDMDLRHGDIDVAIWQGEEMEDSEGLLCERLLEEPIYPYCSPELADSMKFDDPKQLLDCWLIHYESKCFPWEDWFKILDIKMKKSSIQWMEVGTFDLAMNAVAAGHGACLATECLASDYVERGMLVRPFDIGMTPGLTFHLFSDPDSPRRERIKAFSDWLHSEVEATLNPIE
ncbi:putative Bacterial regulatory protein, LysR [Vibrio nigripulchritudo SFn27]|uniref:Putative Bacterial regulatory protein, LysR n=1 Tax=Vibrio nigripulchritudo TaxID=28173 RepID=U4K2B9_9VIBR|nr:LysR substrate-binding domain-containing protein [Vibrio nigripulchritudo]CCN73454.1 putative Bacterial regulatory protein, LysR [Vibrio nigripulchritudo SFn118]CCN83146.1 putative Bacterial regulatory protein, LysR [Vibrio nigripulchritudo BLFn1]CCN86250.1 putative Bacterial regulatory protein, LysR [Vibrio nigripulchritudo SFn27]CCN92810.1 putative Bacterial regulatory protein, LysR [Vibrio nigripulchritudo ENn2]CCO42754.1 putative Bacterial regulatory protein, LysR [Vibrio nigripulchritu